MFREVDMHPTPAPELSPTPASRRTIHVWVARSTIGVIVYGAVLFLSAGSITWIWGWLLLAILATSMFAPLLGSDRADVLAERAKGMYDTGVPSWDKRITTIAGGLMFLLWAVAGCDVRFQWTPQLPLSAHIGGLILICLGYALFVWAMASNPFFAMGVRLQREREQHTVATGPYQYIRHPGYAGTTLAYAATPWLLGSAWALIPGIALAALFVVRSAWEDGLLQAELPDYSAYAKRVRYRIMPGVW
jgi:protein-S-isoprenylcysteine O-methyltransferase Ste14